MQRKYSVWRRGLDDAARFYFVQVGRIQPKGKRGVAQDRRSLWTLWRSEVWGACSA